MLARLFCKLIILKTPELAPCINDLETYKKFVSNEIWDLGFQ